MRLDQASFQRLNQDESQKHQRLITTLGPSMEFLDYTKL